MAQMKIRLPKIKLASTSSKDALDYVLLYLLLLCASGFYFHSTGLAYIVPFALALIAAVCHKLHVNKRVLVLTVVLCLNILITTIFSDDVIRTMLLSMLAIVSAMIMVFAYSKERFICLFCNLMYFLCVGSCLMFFLALVSNSFARIFPAFYDNGTTSYFTGVSFVTLATRKIAMRNQSIFWEPGCFQTYILLAFIFEISNYGERRKSRIISYMIALVTTMSTTGFVALFIAIAIWLLEINRGKSTALINVSISAVALVGVLFAVYEMLPQGVSNRTFDKIFDIINGETNNISVTVRLNSVNYSLQSFIMSPVIGVGSTGLSAWNNVNQSGMRIMSFTPGNWLGRYGGFFGLIAITGFTQWKDKLFDVKINRYILFGLMLIIIATEAYTTNTSIWIFVLYGWINNNAYKMKTKRI